MPTMEVQINILSEDQSVNFSAVSSLKVADTASSFTIGTIKIIVLDPVQVPSLTWEPHLQFPEELSPEGNT